MPTFRHGKITTVLSDDFDLTTYLNSATAIEIDRPSLQISVRAGRDDYPTARDLAQTLRTLVAGMVNVSSSGVTIMRTEPSGSLYSLSTDNLERPRVVFNVDCLVDV